ncbi:Nucleolar protein 4 [Rhizoctonia solani]|uniref:Nucleolar protein 4 n=1 Tax=Rhizoctonia solani TaxID=456999 RepID=A0A0K6FUH8_9AGAM|nr:Nucleolar protein 4 [Rhizoctonia solani]
MSEAGEATHGPTLFVSNLPYTATSTDVQTLFSEVAPVRSAFVVLDKETKVSKGVAYVSFAIKEDASMALESEKPFELDGRILRLQWADKKGVPHHSEKDSSKKPKKISQPKGSSDPEAVRTLIVTNLPDGINSKVLWKKARKIPGASEVVYPAPEHDGHTALVKFSSAAEALAAVSKLHNHIFKGSRLSATIKKRVDKLLTGRKSGAPSRSSRLIIRNLPWHVTESDLHELFAPYGPIFSITLPTTQSDERETTKRHRGFAFIWMLSHADAERALKGVNGQTVGAQKKKKKTKKEREEAARVKAAARLRAMKGEEPEANEASEEEHEEEQGNGSLKEGRVVAVDWALSKSKWEETVSQRQDEEAMEVDDQEEEEQGEEFESEAGSSEEEVSEEESDEESEQGTHERPKLPDTDVGTTLFVRNVPFEATEDDLRTLFRAFGPLRYARITMDHDTGRSKGTGFVCFWKKEDADAAIEEAEAMAKELGTDQPAAGSSKVHNPFSMSLLTPDPSASLAKRLVLHGRTLSVARAVTRGEADRLREEGERSREKQDKRNLYLMREGVIFPNSSAAAGLPEAELTARQAAFDSRKALLRSNPSLYVSRTRISIRRLPLWASERVLKRLAIHAMREFEAEVSRGERDPLTRDELQSDAPEKGSHTKGAKKGRNTGVQQAKIVRAADRVDAVTGKGRSRGYGFIEMSEHADALRVLRWVNNRPGVFGLMRGWWREELKDMVAALKGDTVKGEDREGRLKRLQEELERVDVEFGPKGGSEPKEARASNKTLILEFAIENIQVVKRRNERAEAVRSGTAQTSKKRKASDSTGDEPETRPKKGRIGPKEPTPGKPGKGSKPKAQASSKKVSPESGDKHNIGGIIGRKRRDRRKTRGN